MQGYVDMLMVLSPPDKIIKLVDEYKKDAVQLIGDYEGMHSIAHISIKNLPRQKPYYTEPAVINLLKKLKAMPPVELTIDGFDHFNHGDEFKTIYAKIQSTPAITQWFRELKKHLTIKEYLVPHITIARNIPVDAYNILWPHFREIKWVATFKVEQLTVLHREAFNTFAKWEIYKQIPFESRIPIEDVKPKTQAVDLRKGHLNADRQISLF